MAKKIINTGTTDNDGTGDSLKVGAGKINDNFTEIYTTFGDGTNLTGGAGGGAQGIKGNTGSQGIQGFQGVQGRIGANFNVFATEANVAINPPGNVQTFLNNTYPNAGIGSAVIDDLTNHIWVYQGGSVWLDGGDTSGAQGIAGQYAAQGLQGVLGTQGVQGLQGIQGSQGVQGVQGRDGHNAGQGTQGTFGAQGLQATQGTQGHLGIQGPLGIQGDLGAHGPQGVQGIMGYGAQGFQGIIGNTGTQGTFGQIGPTGGNGPQGVQGLQGLTGQGIQGSLGIQGGGGPAGNTGPQGVQGLQGLQGLSNQGTQGLLGNQGVQGLQGIQGLQGLSNQGVQGNIGPAGPTGPSNGFFIRSGPAGITTSDSVGIGTTTINSEDAVFDNPQKLAVGIVTCREIFADSVSGVSTITGDVGVAGTLTATQLISGKWTLGADGSNNYTFTGPGLTGAENDPTITLIRGQEYQFVNEMGAHPFRIQSTPNGSTGTQYNDGVTNNDVSNGTLTWDVQFDAPNVLYYQCTAHPNMGGRINIINSRRREEVSNSTGSIGAGTTTDITITGYRSYALQKVGISSAAWVRVYTDAASRTADASRLHTTDPTPGSGLIAEGYTTTTGITTFKMTPGVIGWNDNETPNEDIYLKVTNNETGSADITVTLTIVRMEE